MLKAEMLTSKLAENLLFQDHLSSLQQKTAAIINESDCDALLIHSGGLHMHFLDDMALPFAANPHFRHWLPGPFQPDCFLIIEPGQTPHLIYYQPQDFWHGTPPSPHNDWAGHFQIDIISSVKQTKVFLSPQIKIAYIGPDKHRFAQWPITAFNPAKLMAKLHFERAIKSAYEQHNLSMANIRAAKAHKAAFQAFEQGMSEFDIHLHYLKASGHMEAELPYNNIVALNENAAILHYVDLKRRRPDFNQPGSFLIDAGAVHQGYAADITRTYSRNKDEFQQLIAAMDLAQQRIVQQLKPGLDYADAHLAAHTEIATLLKEFNFVNLSPEAIVETGISQAFFPHGLGHLLGLQVHDIGGHQQQADGTLKAPPKGHEFLRLTRILQTGYVLTVEPGLYFIPQLLNELKKHPESKQVNWDKCQKFVPYGGIRIEDNVCIGATVNQNYTRQAFAQLTAE